MPMISGCPRVPSVAVGGVTQGVNLLAFFARSFGGSGEDGGTRALSCFLVVLPQSRWPQTTCSTPLRVGSAMTQLVIDCLYCGRSSEIASTHAWPSNWILSAQTVVILICPDFVRSGAMTFRI